MAISQKFIITNGPSKWDLMLAMFDDTAHPHVRFDIQGEKWDELKKLSADHPDVENYVHVYGLGPKQIETIIQSLGKEDGSGENWYLELYVVDGDRPSQLVRGYYNTQCRKGYLQPVETYDMPPWTCDWCKKSFPDSVQPNQTYDGETICSECFERDDEGPQIARYGIDMYEAKNEPERVVDEDGKVDYE